jgi:DNA ligase-1
MCKDPASPYASGRRGYRWLKLKRPLDTLDVVIVGAEWGHGKRRSVLSDYTFAVRDESGGELRIIGKAYGGLTDAEIADLTERLKAITVEQQGRYRTIRPEIVLEVEFNNIQRSDRHNSGYALRFPRIVRIRRDKGDTDINSLADVARMHELLTASDPVAANASAKLNIPSPLGGPWGRVSG